MMGQLAVPVEALGIRLPLNTDQWDGYPGARARVLNQLDGPECFAIPWYSQEIFHSSWSNDIAPDPYGASYDPLTGEGSVATEIVAPGITSPFFLPSRTRWRRKTLEQTALFLNPHTQFVDFERQGYVIIDVDRQRTRAEWYHLGQRAESR